MIATTGKPKRKKLPPGTSALRGREHKSAVAEPPVRTIRYIPNALFNRPDAAACIEQLRPKAERPAELPPAVPGRRGALYRIPLLSREEERYLFCRMNFEKYQAARLSEKLGQRPGNRTLPKAICRHLNKAAELRNRIVEANLRLVPAVARPFREPGVSIDDLVSAGHLPLIRAAELFDISRGLRFSTYASNAVRNHFLRLRMQRARRRRLQTQASPELLNEAPDRRAPAADAEQRQRHEQSLANRLLGELPPRERRILAARFGLEGRERAQTFREIADQFGLSKERVRVLTHRALEHLSGIAREKDLEPDDGR